MRKFFFSIVVWSCVCAAPSGIQAKMPDARQVERTGPQRPAAAIVRRANALRKARKLFQRYLPEYVDTSAVKEPWWRTAVVTPDFDWRSPFYSSTIRHELLECIYDWLGTRYTYGGNSRRGIDCSAFTRRVMRSVLSVDLPRVSHRQGSAVVKIARDSLQFGDLIFFTGTNRNIRRVGHVGIYIGNGVFAHSSTGRGVIFSHLSDGHYQERFLFGGRIFNTEIAGTFWN